MQLEQFVQQVAKRFLPIRLGPPMGDPRTDRFDGRAGKRMDLDIGKMMVGRDVFLEEEDLPLL